MDDAGSSDGLISVTIQRRSNKKPGFEVEKREEDGFYYITKVPKNCTNIAVGDRVLEINGTTHKDFKSETNANDLVDSLKLDVVPVDDDDEEDDEGEDSEEDYEEVNRSRSISKNRPRKDKAKSSGADGNSRSKIIKSQSEDIEDDSGYGDNWNDVDEMKTNDNNWTDEDFDNNNTISEINNGEVRPAANRDGISKQESWDRPYVSQYKPRDRFMITVMNGEEKSDGDLGIELLEFENGEIYVSEVNEGPFYETALNRGDKILSINGKKIPNHIDTVEEAMGILQSKSKLTVFVLRPSKKDKGFRWVLKNT